MTTTRPIIRRPWRRRITTAVWGLLVAGVGALAIIELQGYNVDLQLALIAALVVLGAWLLVSAALPSGRKATPPAPRSAGQGAAEGDTPPVSVG